MSRALSERRARLAWRAAAAAAALAGTAFVAVSLDRRSLEGEAAAGPVLPDLAQRLEGARRILVVSREGGYRIERGEQGWVMRDRGDFPVRPEHLRALGEGLVGLRFERRMTSDPDKFDRIGLGDPGEGGRGLLLQVEDDRGAFIVDLVLGVESEAGGLYVRRANERQAWAAGGELPPLRSAAAWLDLAPLLIPPEAIMRVEIARAGERAYSLIPADDGAGFFLEAPGGAGRARSAFELEAIAHRMTQLQPIDVAPAPAVQGAQSARIRLFTSSGVEVDAELIALDGGDWLKLVARAPGAEASPEAQAQAGAINERAAGWAYQLSQAEARALAPALETVLQAPAPPGLGAPPL